jgi:hypothetical protein
MNVPQQRLAAPEIPGYHTHWFTGEPARLERARQAGYTFVTKEEVGIFDPDLAGLHEGGSGTDLGSRVSVVAGGVYEGSNVAQRLYLMKLPDALWAADLESMGKVNERIASALRGDGQNLITHGTAPAGSDSTNTYRGEDAKRKMTLFHRKH